MYVDVHEHTCVCLCVSFVGCLGVSILDTPWYTRLYLRTRFGLVFRRGL